MKKSEIYVYKYGMKDTIQDEIRLRCRGFANNITDYIDSELQKVDKTLFNQWAENELLRNTIDKAIEYIENSDKYDFSKCELLDILKGSDE